MEFSPATYAVSASSICTPQNPPPKNPVCEVVQLAPASVEKMIVCDPPPATPLPPLNDTARRSSVTSVVTLSQDEPVSVVRRIVPPLPTIMAVLLLIILMVFKSWVVPEGIFSQLLPPSVVLRIIPPSPTAIT